MSCLQGAAQSWVNNRKKDLKLVVGKAYYGTFLDRSHLEPYGLPGFRANMGVTVSSSLNTGMVIRVLELICVCLLNSCVFDSIP
jgi:hypothetical protein